MLLCAVLLAGCGDDAGGGQDARPADSSQDQGQLDATSPDGPSPDQGKTTGPVLLSGGVGGAGPVSAGSFVLLEGGFTRGGAVCKPSAGLCLSGGITP